MAQAYLFTCGDAVWFVEGATRLHIQKIGKSLYIRESKKSPDASDKRRKMMTSQEVLDLLETAAPQLLAAIREWKENK